MQAFAVAMVALGVAYALGIGWLLIGMRRSFAVSAPGQQALRSVTVILPARNEARSIPGCLETLSKQDYPPDLWEVVVVNDGSEDETRERAAEWSGRIARIRVIDSWENAEGIGPKKNALLTGIASSDGDVILTTDADARLGPRWIRTMVKALGDEAAVVGPVFLRGSKRWVPRFLHVESLAGAVIACGGLGWGVGVTCIGANFGYTREAFRKVGGFGRGAREVSGDDDLLLQRVTRSGLGARFATGEGARVSAGVDTTLRGAWTRRRRHLSAAKRYPLPLKLAGAGWFAYCGMIAGGTVWGALAAPGVLGVALAGWAWKAALETLAVRRGAAAFGEPVGWGELLGAVLIHPWLLLVSAPASMLGRVRWKGRALRVRAATSSGG